MRTPSLFDRWTIKGLHHAVAVLRVHVQQLQDDEAQGATFVGGLCLRAFPQFGIDAAQRVRDHARSILSAGCVLVGRKLSAGCLDRSGVVR